MSGHDSRRASSSIGALTRRDRYREATLNKKIDDAYRSLSTTSSVRLRRRALRAAHRHERALVAQRRRPQSVLTAFALASAGALAGAVLTGAPSTIALIALALLLVDLQVLRRRKRKLRLS